MKCATYSRACGLLRKLQCRLKRQYDWITTTTFTPPPQFEDGALGFKFNMLLLLACSMGLPEFAILGTGITDVERLCHRCGKYEKGTLWGEATTAEASQKPLRSCGSK
jgi:hypothetical protein